MAPSSGGDARYDKMMRRKLRRMELELTSTATFCLTGKAPNRHWEEIPPERIWGKILSSQNDVLEAGCFGHQVSRRVSAEVLEHVKHAWRHFVFPCSMVWAENQVFGLGGTVLWDALFRSSKSNMNGPTRGAMAATAGRRVGEKVVEDDVERLLPCNDVQDTCYSLNSHPLRGSVSRDAVKQSCLEIGAAGVAALLLTAEQ